MNTLWPPRAPDMNVSEPDVTLAIIVGLVVILFIGTAMHGGLARACKRQLARYTLWRLDSKRSVNLDTEVVSNWALLHDELRCSHAGRWTRANPRS